jgi:Glycosidases
VSNKKLRLLNRIPAIELFPVVENGTLNAKATEGEAFPIRATVFREGHDSLAAEAVLINPEGKEHARARMYDVSPGNDLFEAWLMPDRPGLWSFRVDTWMDPWATWKHDARLKIGAAIDAELMCLEGSILLERAATGQSLRSKRPPANPPLPRVKPPSKLATLLTKTAALLKDRDLPPSERFAAANSAAIDHIMVTYPLRDLVESTLRYPVQVDRRAALYGSWYEVFPRSLGAFIGPDGKWVSGTLQTAAKSLERIADMGFTVIYLTPVHPIGLAFRKGRNNSLEAGPEDPGSPYGIGSADGGHDAIHKHLGDFDDFDHFVEVSNGLGMEVALDLALQCSPDHPWVTEHPEWFSHRADGSIAYAENPPKKYQDIYPLNFDNDPEGIFDAIVDIVEVWISHGVKIFRVDNPHTKPIPFWERFLAQMREDHPEVIFLAEAFTRPAMMRTLGMVGFQQSYTYFAWRTTKTELEDYFVEVARSTSHLIRPAFWPTTHDILTPQMTTGGAAIFSIRAILAACGSPTWGIYSGYELVENEPRPGFEEQNNNEKYEYRPRDWSAATQHGIEKLLELLNRARQSHPALRQLHQISIHETSSEDILCFSKHVPGRFTDSGKDDTVIVVVSLNPDAEVEGTVTLDWDKLLPSLSALGTVSQSGPIKLVDELDGTRYTWTDSNYVKFSPWERLGHVFGVIHE